MTRPSNSIELATRVTVDDGGVLDRGHTEIMSLITPESSKDDMKRVSEALRLCARPARFRVLYS